MRLAQYARKINEKPSVIAQFLQNNFEDLPAIQPNTLLTETHITAITKQFTPSKIVVKNSAIDSENRTQQVIIKQHIDESGTIKAPKISMEGVKVVGKIALPEQNKPKEEEEVSNYSEEDTSDKIKQTIEDHRANLHNQKQHSNKKTHSAHQEKEKRIKRANQHKEQKEKEAEKRRKKSHYEKMMQQKKQQPTKKKTKKKTKSTATINTITQEQKPTSLWRKFTYWLNH